MKQRNYIAAVVHRILSSAMVSVRALAHHISKPASTVWSWCKRAQDLAGGEEKAPPGPKAKEAGVLVRNDIIGALYAAGGRLSTEELRTAYPDVTRAAIRRLQQKFRRLTKKRKRRSRARLHWSVTGAVWAMDHTYFEGGVEDAGTSVLVIRDLASGVTLFAEPCGQDAASVCAVLLRLFARHGAPIALKCDNGSGYVAEETKLLLALYGVLVLYSPPGTPSYNGSCEANVGSVKHRAQDLSAMRGVLAVSRSDLLMAQEQANAGAVFAPCRPELEMLRGAVWRHYQKWVSRLREREGLALEVELDHAAQASLDRTAISKALQKLAILTIRRRDYRCRLSPLSVQ